jgi:hypothetical protein
VAERDTVFIHVHGGDIPIMVFLNFCFLDLPRLTIVLTAVDLEWGWWLPVLYKDENVAGGRIDRSSSTMVSLF